MRNIKENLNTWAQKHVAIFNKITDRGFYTQSPLCKVIYPNIEQMVIGINPAGETISRKKDITPEEYLKGNNYWDNRFNTDGTINKEWLKYLGGTRFFLGYPPYRSTDSIDDDSKTVWTNLSPFFSPKGSADLSKELMTVGIESTLELITILMPKRILLLGVNAFFSLNRYSDKVEYEKLFSNQKISIGRIAGIPSICVPHPSGQWDLNHYFDSLVIHLHRLIDVVDTNGQFKPLKEVVDIMRKEILDIQTKVAMSAI